MKTSHSWNIITNERKTRNTRSHTHRMVFKTLSSLKSGPTFPKKHSESPCHAYTHTHTHQMNVAHCSMVTWISATFAHSIETSVLWYQRKVVALVHMSIPFFFLNFISSVWWQCNHVSLNGFHSISYCFKFLYPVVGYSLKTCTRNSHKTYIANRKKNGRNQHAGKWGRNTKKNIERVVG